MDVARRAFGANEESFIGGVDLEGVALAGDDLAVDGAPIANAPQPRVGLASSTANERHHAINWLVGAHPIYSRVVTPT